MDEKERLKELIASAIDDGYMEFGDAYEMFADIIDSYLTSEQCMQLMLDYFPGVSESYSTLDDDDGFVSI